MAEWKDENMVITEAEISFDWKCKKCPQRYPMLTKDGNEEWAFCCGEPMTMQPKYKLVAKLVAKED